MDGAELQALLRGSAETMPNKARRVVEYILSNMREAAFLSIGEVAENLDVSRLSLSGWPGSWASRVRGPQGSPERRSRADNPTTSQQDHGEQAGPAGGDPQDGTRQSRRNAEPATLSISSSSADGAERPDGLLHGLGISSSYRSPPYTAHRDGHPELPPQERILAHRAGQDHWRGDLVVAPELPSYVIEVTESIEKAKSNGHR